MNENTLILTEHRVLPRLVDAGLTLLAWLGFLFFLYANLLMQFIAPPSPRWESLMASLNTAAGVSADCRTERLAVDPLVSLQPAPRSHPASYRGAHPAT
ncbi:hemin storage system protein [Klebsiella variicola]|nr:hemin storage system protein [Klebsiella variicola]